MERHGAFHKDVADAVQSLTQAMHTAVKDGVSEGKQQVNTVARCTAGACAGVTALQYFDIKLVFQKKKRHADSRHMACRLVRTKK